MAVGGRSCSRTGRQMPAETGAWHDVPAPDVRRLADEEPLVAVLPAQGGGVVAAGPGCEGGGGQAHGDAVRRPGEQRGGDVEAVPDEHVVRAADLDAVHPDGRQRVEPLEDEVPVAAGGVVGRLELAQQPPLVVLQVPQAADVVGVEGLGQEAGALEVEFDVAGHAGGGRLKARGRQVIRAVDLRLALREVVEPPVAAEVDGPRWSGAWRHCPTAGGMIQDERNGGGQLKSARQRP